MVRYKKIALAATFSPRLLPLLAEAARLAQKLDCDFSLIHAGEETEESRGKFEAAFKELALPKPPHIHWAKGGEHSAAILQTIREESIGLLIAGALENETPGRHYVGNVARSLLRDAPCSLLLFINPTIDPQPFRQIVAITDFSELSVVSLEQTYFLAAQNSAESIRIVRIFTVFTQARAKPQEYGKTDSRRAMLEAEEKHIAEFAASVGESPVPVETACVEGTTGFAASDYVEAVKADLLVIPSKPVGTAQLLPDGMDWVFSVIPSNLFIVRGPASPGLRRDKE